MPCSTIANQCCGKSASQASTNVQEYEIAGRRLKHYSMGELLQLRDRLRGEVAREQAATNAANGTGGAPGRIYVRFGQ